MGRDRNLIAAGVGLAVLGVAAGARAMIKTPKAARDMTHDEARDELDKLHAAGIVNVLSGTGRRIVIASTIDRVRFSYGIKEATPPTGDIGNLDIRMAILLARLAKFVRIRFKATTIRHLGISAGNGPANDCHNEGRAIDFAGLEGDGWRTFVLNDWGSKPAGYPSDTEDTHYRLDARRYPGELYARVYDFFAREATDTSEHRGRNGTPTTLGASARFIVNPDHHNPFLRATHIDHIHAQIGPTLGPDPDA